MKYSIPEYVEYVRVDDDRAVLSSPVAKKELTGESVELVSQLIPVLRDGATVEELAEATGIEEQTIEALLDILAQTEQISSATNSQADFWDWVSNTPDTTRERLESATIGVFTTVDNAPPTFDWTEPKLLSNFADVTDESSQLDLLLTISNGVRPSFHRAILEETFAASLPWLPVRLVGSELRLGPLTRPNRGACYNCYYQRSVASQPETSVIIREHEQRESTSTHAPYLESIYEQMYSMLELEATAYLSEFRQPNTSGTVVSYDILQQTTNHANVLKLPGCEICGTN